MNLSFFDKYFDSSCLNFPISSCIHFKFGNLNKNIFYSIYLMNLKSITHFNKIYIKSPPSASTPLKYSAILHIEIKPNHIFTAASNPAWFSWKRRKFTENTTPRIIHYEIWLFSIFFFFFTFYTLFSPHSPIQLQPMIFWIWKIVIWHVIAPRIWKSEPRTRATFRRVIIIFERELLFKKYIYTYVYIFKSCFGINRCLRRRFSSKFNELGTTFCECFEFSLHTKRDGKNTPHTYTIHTHTHIHFFLFCFNIFKIFHLARIHSKFFLEIN